MKRKRILSFLLSFLLLAQPLTGWAANETGNEAETMDYLRQKNLKGPSGVPLGGAGVGYYEISPDGKVTRTCLNNIHKPLTDTPSGFTVAVYDGKNASRLQRGSDKTLGLTGYTDSYYTGLWPTVHIDFEKSANGTADMGFTAYSGVVAQNVKDSALPAVYYEVELRNPDGAEKEMSALLSFGDLIGRGIRDTDKENPSNLDGESSEWHDIAVPATYAKGITVEAGGVVYRGVKQYAKEQILPQKATFQNYNNTVMILAEENGGCEITVLPSFDAESAGALSGYGRTGSLEAYSETEKALSAANPSGSRKTEKASAVAVKTTVGAGETKKIRFLVTWFMPEITEEQYTSMHRMEGCDYNKYYHNYFSTAEELTAYAITEREAIRAGIDAWQRPILESSLPSWLIFKEINSGYVFYTNGVLNKRGNFSTLEGEMGGLGGTMDQKMSSHPFYEKLFPSLNLAENSQYANVLGANGEIQHFDVHYYHGIADSDPENKVNPTPNGSMIDNGGSWMVQMWDLYAQTGDDTYLKRYRSEMESTMKFIMTKYAAGTHYPCYNTTYDDFSHPAVMIYSGIVWLTMLDIAADWSEVCGDAARADFYRKEAEAAEADVELLWCENGEEDLSYYAYGSDRDYLASRGKSGEIKSSLMFSGAVAGEFISRYAGRGDVIAFEKYAEHLNAFLRTAVQNSGDYYAPKVFNIRTQQNMDAANSSCWPFYLDSYGAMAAIQAGYPEDGLEILLHTMLVDLTRGFEWTQDLWVRAYATYMTAPVSWFLNDVLAGSALDVPGKTLTLGPTAIASEGIGTGERLTVPLYYPKFWAELDYRPSEGVFTYRITKTFYGDGEAPIAFEKVRALPAGTASEDAKEIALSAPFAVKEGEILDLSAHLSAFEGTVREKVLTPVGEYQGPSEQERTANGTGLSASVTFDGKTEPISVGEVDLVYNAENPPFPGVKDEYVLSLSGRIMPRYSQKYQLLVEYTGEEDGIVLSFDGKEITDPGRTLDDVESQQYRPTEGRKLLVCTADLTGGKTYKIGITYRGDVSDKGDDVLRLLWWSSMQNMGVVIHERLFPEVSAYGKIVGTEFFDTNTQIEGDHIAYTKKGTYAIYDEIDFGDPGTGRFALAMNAAAIDSDVSRGGTMEIRLGNRTGKLLGTLDFEPTGGWGNYREVTAVIDFGENVTGKQDICFVFKPISDFLLNYTDFTFRPLEDNGEDDPGTDEPEGVDATDWVGGVSFAEGNVQNENGHVAYTQKNTFALYKDLNFGTSGASVWTLTMNAAAPLNDVSKGGTMEIRLDGKDGDLLGTLGFTPNGDWGSFAPVTTEIDFGEHTTGLHDICFVFKPDSDFLLNYTDFRFTPDLSTAPETEPETAAETAPADTEPGTAVPGTDAESDPGEISTSRRPVGAIAAVCAGAAALIGAAAVFLAKKKKK
ncbi:MAG: carbohydrate-binding protein [Lachnospiraceae bacterium]|nr:carbohydrate-binding protein [Lachnospiraceae bacterium]